MGGGRGRWALATLLVLGLMAAPVLSIAPASARTVPGPKPFAAHDPILIEGNADFTPENGVVGGTGSPEDPFRIEGHSIFAGDGPGIVIRNTSASFAIRNVTVRSDNRGFDGIVLENLSNATLSEVDLIDVASAVVLRGVAVAAVRDSNVTAASQGIVLDAVVNLTLTGNGFNGVSGSAFRIADSSQVTLEANSFLTVGVSIDVSRTPGVHVVGNRIWRTILLSEVEGPIVRSNEVSGTLVLNRTTNATVEDNYFRLGGVVLEGDRREHYASHSMAGNSLSGREIRYVHGCADLLVDGAELGQLLVADCRGVRLTNLTLSEAAVAVGLAFVEDALVEGNVLSNSSYGLRLHHVSGAFVRNNTLRFIRQAGVVLLDSESATIYRNNFVQARAPVERGGQGNAWHAPYPEGGNYWSLFYFGPDICGGVGQVACGTGDGFGDVPHTPAEGIVDPYPRTRPFGLDDRRPVAAMTLSRDRIAVGEPLIVDTDGSYDPQGGPLSALWDFGDGNNGAGSPISHAYTRAGTYTVTLRVMDSEWLSDIVSTSIRVLAHPVAHIETSADVVVVGEVVAFNGSASYSPETRIASYTWSFGDGAMAAGETAEHAYSEAGTYEVLLEVADADGIRASMTVPLYVLDAVVLEPYSHRQGFVVDVPSGWSVHTQADVGGGIIELEALGPMYESSAARLIVDAEFDPTAEETTGYLAHLMTEIMEEIRAGDPGAVLFEGPTYRPIADHPGVVFAIQGEEARFTHRVAIVVREDLDHYWVILMTNPSAFDPILGDAFLPIVDRFEITYRPLVLLPYEHPSAGFRLPVPEGWDIQEDVALGGTTVELVLFGPTEGGALTNILVDTGADPTVRETDAYLLSNANQVIQGIRADAPSVTVMEGPSLRRIADHAGVTFKLQHGRGQAYQTLAIVVSEAHDRFWILLLTTDGPSFRLMDEGFGRMLDGFVITLAPNVLGGLFDSSGLTTLLLIGGLVAVAIVVVVVIRMRSRSKRRGLPQVQLASAPTPIVAAPPTPAAWPRLCNVCGFALDAGATFCGRCGSTITPPPPSPDPGRPPGSEL